MLSTLRFGALTVLISALSFSTDVQAQGKAAKTLNDFASIQIGPLKVNHRDGPFNPTSADKMSYPGIFGSSHYLIVGRRSVGFGGSAGDLELRIPRTTPGFDTLFSRNKGGFQIINHLYTKDERPVGFPDQGAFLSIDYRKSKANGTSTYATLARSAKFNDQTWAKGSARFERVSRKVEKFTDAFGNNKETTTVQLLFTVNGSVKDLNIYTTLADGSSSVKTLDKAKVSGEFLMTLQKTITILKP